MSITTETTAQDVTAAEVTELPAGIVARFHTTAAALDRALRISVLAASTDNTLPILHGVALTYTAAGNVAVMATDRYKLVYALVETVTEDKDGKLPHVVEALTTPAVIPLPEVKALTAWVKPLVKALGAWGNLTVSLERTDTAATPDRLTVTAPTGSAYVVELVDGEYPRIAGLFPEAVTDQVGTYAVNPTYLEHVAKMAKLGCERNTPVVFTTGATAGKPVQFRGASDGKLIFHGLLMPVRLPDTGTSYNAERI